METAISVTDLSKRYRIGGNQGYATLRENIVNNLRLPRFKKPVAETIHDGRQDHFWALDKVSFEVKRGEILGIIGSNGAGKSTALKILSRITRPTAGRIELYGRVRSLLEVGTGFHPELTGRENIFLNGAILGMRRGEIARKFDEIVDFAGVEKFIETPVKRYSSGMYVRLAFAVAAHLEPEILLVDEVLAVGDTQFYQKSTDKMRELNQRGMTIVLVSHQMWLIQTVCTRGILLKHGRIAEQGRPQVVIDAYRRAVEASHTNPSENIVRPGQAELQFVELLPIGDWASEREATPESGIKVRMVALLPNTPRVKFFIRVASPDGFTFFTVYSEPVEVPATFRLTGEATIPRLMLRDGDYFIWAGVCSDREKEEAIIQTHLPLLVIDYGSSHPETGIFCNNAFWNFT